MTAPVTIICPSEETLAAFIDGRLDSEARRKVIEHMAVCGDCRSVGLMAAEYAASEHSGVAAPSGGVAASRFSPRFYFSAAAALAAAAVVIVLLGPAIRQRAFPAKRGIDALAEAYETVRHRPTEARLSGPFSYKPPPQVLRGGDTEAETEAERDERWRLFGVAGEIRQAAHERATSENLHALGVSYVLTREFDDAVKTLELVAKRVPDHPEVLNDLATAYYGRAVASRSPSDFASALDVLQRPALLKVRSPAVLFNRALAMEALLDREQALSAWRDFLTVDRASGWADDAREHVQDLENRPVSQWDEETVRRELEQGTAGLSVLIADHPVQARRHVADIVLPAWANQMDADALGQASAIISRLRARPGKCDVCATIDQVRSLIQSRSAEVDEAAAGFQSFARGREAAAKGHTDDAVGELLRSYDILSGVQNPLAVPAAMYAGFNQYSMSEYERALHTLSRAETAADKMKVTGPWRAEVRWVQGMVLLATGRPHQSLLRYEEALSIFEQCDERDNVGAIHGMIAENLEMLGESKRAWEHRLHALSIITERNDRQRLQIVMNEAAEAAANAGQVHLALAFQTAVTRLAEESGDPFLVTYARLWRALIRFRTGDVEGAFADMRSSRIAATRIPDRAAQAKVDADIDMIEGLQNEESTPHRAVSFLSRSLEYHSRHGNRFRTADLLFAKGRAEERLNDLTAASSDYQRGIAELEQQGSLVGDDHLRSALLSRTEEIFDRAINAALNAGKPEQAFAIAERGRAYSLRGFRHEGRWTAGSHSSVQEQLPADAVLLVYAVLDDTLVVWTIRQRSFGVTRLLVAARELERLVSSMRDPRGGIDLDAAAPLYQFLVASALGPDPPTRLIVVPDKVLHQLPFAALFDSFRQQYLIEQATVAVVPSAAAYVETRSAASGHQSGAEGLLVIGSSRERVTPQRMLPALPQIVRETRSVCGSSAGCRLFIDDSATLARFREAASSAAGIHIAGHVLTNDRVPSLSALVLTPDPPHDDGLLYVRDIVDLKLKAKVIVLSACESIEKRGRGVHAHNNLAWAFLAAGGTTVIGSLWPIEDRPARELFTRIHEELRREPSPGRALRNLQLAKLREDRRGPAWWAALELVGSDV